MGGPEDLRCLGEKSEEGLQERAKRILLQQEVESQESWRRGSEEAPAVGWSRIKMRQR